MHSMPQCANWKAGTQHRPDAGKKIKGKKRHTAVDTLGLLINFAAGDVQDRNMIAPLLAIASKRFPSLQKAIADGQAVGNG